METLNRSSFALRELKFAEPEAGVMAFEGYGAYFNNKDAHGDVIKPGAFAETLTEARDSGYWPAMLSQHGGFGLTADDDTPIGIWDSLEENARGLKVKGRLADTPRGKEHYTLMKMEPRPAINGLSIGYFVKEFERGTKPDEPRRTITKIELLEISLVTFPANSKARVSGVKAIDALHSPAEIEAYLREAGGLSRNEAKHLIAKIKGVDLREAEASNDLVRIFLNNEIGTIRG